eukprot:gnl/MRDRNA2_/MRDRNA2_30772_c0_seq1.p1 gnl/MRDRNA2_/MRDRNA2_30772_c0~~gnl/MRDRNA2_/MRDRNA2_30772_c0_seq1.p1  ORF type:complete len:1420 (+),score=277.93 gnl/MRDRNA2_/MRDRNA2_30772_c0_seq1:31-4290(+)
MSGSAKPTKSLFQCAILFALSGGKAAAMPSAAPLQMGYLSYLTFSWLNPMLEHSTMRQIGLHDAPGMLEADSTFLNVQLFQRQLDLQEAARNSHPMLRAFMHAFWPQLVLVQSLAILQYLIGLIGPFLLKAIMVFQEAQSKNEESKSPIGQVTKLDHDAVTNGVRACMGLIFVGLFSIILDRQVSFYRTRIGIRMGSALRGAVLSRCVRGAGLGSTDNSEDGSKPAVYNVLSFDVGPSVDIIWTILGLWLFPLQLVTVCAALYTQVQWAFWPGLIVILVVQVINLLSMIGDGYLRDYLLKAKDCRLGRCDEGFGFIRTLRMLSWEGVFGERIMEARNEELRIQQMRLWAQKMPAAFSYTLGSLVTLATLAYYVTYYGESLKASTVLPVIGLISSLIGPLSNFPTWSNQYLVWRSAYGRLNKFMGLAVHPRQEILMPFAGDSSSEDTEIAATLPDNYREIGGFQGCTLAWPKGGSKRGEIALDVDVEQPLLHPDASSLRPCLMDLDIGVNPFELLVLVGKEGQGKTSVLHALLGEMVVLSGSVHSPAIARCVKGLAARRLNRSTDFLCQRNPHDVSWTANGGDGVFYSAQEIAIVSGTVRENIVFGAPYNPDLFASVIDACALDKDVAAMPDGDLTDVPFGGATLSGGQRARLGLARAVYNAMVAVAHDRTSSPLVLLDDPFASLDRKVASHIADSLFGAQGLLLKCAVVVATADPWWLSKRKLGLQHNLAILRAGQVVAQGGWKDVHDQEEMQSVSEQIPGDDERSTLRRSILHIPGPQDPSKNPQDEDAQDIGDNGGAFGKICERHTQTELIKPTKKCTKDQELVNAEARKAGCVKLRTYSAYLEAMGGKTVMMLICTITGIMAMQQIVSLWLTYWVDDHKDKNFAHKYFTRWFAPSDQHSYLMTYAWLVAGFLFFNVAGHASEIIGGMSAAKTIFQKALQSTLLRPFIWWDTNPTGRVLNRFSQDVETMDNAITNIFGVILGAVLYFIGHTTCLAMTNPFCLALLPAVILALEMVAKYYRVCIRELHRLVLINTSPVYQNMVESIACRVTICAFASSDRVIHENIEGLDSLQRLLFVKSSVGEWLGLRMQLIGYVLNTFAITYPILSYFQIVPMQSAALVGFSISYAQELTGIIQQFINNFSDMEMQLISIERLQEYGAMSNGAVGQAQDVQVRASGGNGTNNRLQFRNVTVTYRSGLRPALRDVSLSMSTKEIIGIFGRTGAGKSTLLLSILQLVEYTGEIWLDGDLLKNLDSKKVRQDLIGVVPQSPVLFAGDVRVNIDPESKSKDEAILDILKLVGLASVTSGPLGLKTPVAVENPGVDKSDVEPVQLSQGQKQLLCAARVLLRKPKVALLDEVSASLEPQLADSILRTLLSRFTEGDATVLLVTHQEELKAHCDRIITVADGRIASDVPAVSA